MQDRLVALEERVRSLEDEKAVCRLIARWGPAADTADGRAASWFWTEDAVLETERGLVHGSLGIQELIDSDGQRDLVRQGCAHVHSFPVVRIDGDQATAVNYGRVYLHTEDGYDLWRVSVNSWEFRRTEDGWRITSRRVHVIDGGPEALGLLKLATSNGADR